MINQKENGIMNLSKFEVQTGIDDNYFFNLKDQEGKIILSSGGYQTKKGCEAAIKAVREMSQVEDGFVINQIGTGQYTFELVNSSKEKFGKSDVYCNTDELFDEMDCVTENAKEAVVFYSLN